MHHFSYRNGHLHAEDNDLTRIAEDIGTPFYCYSEATLRRHFTVFRDAFDGRDTLIAFSVKANSNIAVLKILASEGAGADIVSVGEYKRARAAGIPAEKIVFSGVGKTRDELNHALSEGVHQFNVESENELHALNAVALERGARAPIAFRVNPDVSAGGHEKISTGKAEDKFGIPWRRARALYAEAAALNGIDIKGVDVHIGSQITALAPFEAAFQRVADLVTDLRSDGITIERIDLGGGLGIPYGNGETPPDPLAYAKMIRKVTDKLDVQLIFEPGRMIAGNAGILVSRAVYVKKGEASQFLIVDAAMNDLMRPALYDARHEIMSIIEPDPSANAEHYDVVGPVCETGDRFAKARPLPPIKEGDLIAFMSAGAYGAVLSSQYNTRPLVPEVLVNGNNYAVVRRRPTFEDIMTLEATPDWLG
ncbi:MAG: diaminopimelate decarboxylase [Pseudomonadota bacterium]